MTEFTKRILDNIRLQRAIKGYSTDYMGHKLGINQKSYSKVENGITRLTTDRLSNIADVFEVSIKDLIN